jgi:hypothetical protein
MVGALRQAQVRVTITFFLAALKPPSSSWPAVAARDSWKRASILLVTRVNSTNVLDEGLRIGEK